MIQLLVSLKKKLPFIWRFVEYLNGILFKVLFATKVRTKAQEVLEAYKTEPFEYRFLNQNDLNALVELFSRQDQEQFKYFKPHEFDTATVHRLYKNASFLMLGVFENQQLVGYFFLRCFVNKKSFIGKIVDGSYQGRGIAKTMGRIAQNIAWINGFRVFGTGSKNNIKSLKSSKATNNFKVIKELEDDYIFYEYLQSEEKPIEKSDKQ